MEVKKMIRGKSGMFHESNPATVGETVAVIPWNEWEEVKEAIISLVGTTERKVTEDERLDAELKMFSIYQSIKESNDG